MKKTKKTTNDTWIWVEGYKGVSEDMTAYGGFQYEVGKQYDIPEGEEIAACRNGFHFCRELSDVFTYVHIVGGNRFFRVKALVRAEDYVKGGMEVMFSLATPKLVAKSIILTEEIDTKTIFEEMTSHSHFAKARYGDWSDEDKETARRIGLDATAKLVRLKKLQNAGYTPEFAELIKDDEGRFGRALAVAALPGVSADAKALIIFGCNR